MYLIDTNVVSELRRKAQANSNVTRFFDKAVASGVQIFVSAVTVGELRRGVELLRHRGDAAQAALLETWLASVLEEYGANVLSMDVDAAQIWGRLCVPDSAHAIDKQIAAIALLYDLTLVTRNTSDFLGTGVKLIDPFVEVP